MPVSPLNIQVRMVNEEGQPTPEFMRWWQEFLTTVNPLAYPTGVSDLLDVIGSTWGSILIRGETGWALLTPGTAGTALLTQGASADPIWGLPATTFIDLTDTDPTSYSGEAGKVVAVNAGEDGLEFIAPVASWIDLDDTDPTSYSGEAGNVVAVNAGEDGLEFIAPPAGASAAEVFKVRKNATQSITTTNITVTWQTVDFDTASGFASDIFTVPAALDAAYMVFFTEIEFAAVRNHEIYLEHDTGSGYTLLARSGTTVVHYSSITTGPILVATGDKIRVRARLNSGSTTIASNSRVWFSGFEI